MQLTAAQITAIIKKTREKIENNSDVTPISTRQKRSIIDSGIKAGTPICICTVAFPIPQDLAEEAKTLLLDAIAFLGNGNEQFSHPKIPEVLEAEWMGHLPRPIKEHELQISEQQKHEQIIKHSSNTTIFYVYGGMFFTNVPATVRPTVSALCKLSGANAFTMRYRLAPQNPFPNALLDILIGYLSLLYPPPGSSHSPIPASRIVFAGDSAGACLILAVTQVLLYASRHSIDLSYQGKRVPYSLPGGITMVSPYADLAHALHSWTANANQDLLPDVPAYLKMDFPPDEIWPSIPPRAHIYADASVLAHPLVSPSTARDWTGSPPIWLAIGEERLADSAKVVVWTARSQGVVVQLEEYQSMPHIWMVIFKKWWQSERCMKNWGESCKRFGEGNAGKSKVEVVMVNREIRMESVDELDAMGPLRVEKLIRKKMGEMMPWTGGKVRMSNL